MYFIKKVFSPLLVLHGRKDNIVPFEMGEQIFKLANNQSTKRISLLLTDNQQQALHPPVGLVHIDKPIKFIRQNEENDLFRSLVNQQRPTLVSWS